MGKKQDAIYQQLLAAITALQKPESNPAQNALTQEALSSADYFKKGDFSSMPKGMVFDFKAPQEQMKQYQNLTNVGNEGTFALGADGGDSQKIAKNYLNDKFARDASQNYQDNISGAANKTKDMLAQAAGAKGQTDNSVISALSSLYQNMPKSNGWLGGLLSMGGALGSAALTKW